VAIVRSVKLQDTIVRGSGLPVSGIQIQATLVPPSGAGPLLDLNGEIIDLTPLSTVTGSTGAYAFDPAATPSNGVIAPGDVQQWSGGSLVPLPGCVWQINYLGVLLTSPSFAYTASTIAPSSWTTSYVSARTGQIRMVLVAVEANGAPDTSARVTISPAQDAVWTGGAGSGQLFDATSALQLSADSAGSMADYFPPSSQLTPVTPFSITLPSGQSTAFTVPDTYTGSDQGAYDAGTTYALTDIVQVSGVPYISLAAANTGNDPTASPSWWGAYAGEPIIAHLTPATLTGSVSYAPANILPSANVPAIATDPVAVPATLDDDLHNLAARSTLGDLVVQSKTGAYPALATDDLVLVDATGGTVVLTLPSAIGQHKRLTIKKIDSSANAVTLTPVLSQTIDGAGTLALTTQWQIAAIASDNANWFIL
jgi:hypothetical protein